MAALEKLEVQGVDADTAQYVLSLLEEAEAAEGPEESEAWELARDHLVASWEDERDGEEKASQLLREIMSELKNCEAPTVAMEGELQSVAAQLASWQEAMLKPTTKEGPVVEDSLGEGKEAIKAYLLQNFDMTECEESEEVDQEGEKLLYGSKKKQQEQKAAANEDLSKLSNRDFAKACAKKEREAQKHDTQDARAVSKKSAQEGKLSKMEAKEKRKEACKKRERRG